MDFHPGWLIVGAVAFLIIWTNPRLKGLLVLSILLFVLLAASKSMLHSETCAGEADCLVHLQPTYAGPCFPTSGGAVLKTTDGNYYLTAESGASGGATCVDWRFWR